MRTLTWFALLSLTACHQTLPPLDEEGNAESTTDPMTSITTVPKDTTSTTDVPTSGSGSTSTGEDPVTSDPTLTTITTVETTVETTIETTEVDTSGTTVAPVCGDEVVEGDEACDAGAANSDVKQGACRTDCTLAGCGDGVVDFVLAEGCDDGNLADDDGCSAACVAEAPPSCGDGVLEPGDGEACDDNNTNDGDGCSAVCAFEPLGGADCGDDAVAGLEVCDDGNVMNGDACNPTCSLGNTTSLFVGTVGVGAPKDGIGMAAQISGVGAMVIVGDTMYLADGTNDSIRSIDLNTRAVVTIAGSTTGQASYVDNPVGLMARFSDVEAITSDGETLWVGDRVNHRLRAVSLTPPHAVTTVACSGIQGIVDDVGLLANCHDIRGLTYYKGLVYMVDAGGRVLRSFDPVSGAVKTLAGNAQVNASVDGMGFGASFKGPRHMTADSTGLLYIADSDGFTLRTYHTVTGYVNTILGVAGMTGYVDGDLATARLSRPRGLAVDGTSLYFLEIEQHTLRQLDLATQTVSTNLGQHCDGMLPCMGGYMEGTGTAAQLSGPLELVYHHPGKALYVLDSVNKVIRKIE
jgi:cysteine-rich repeat protein